MAAFLWSLIYRLEIKPHTQTNAARVKSTRRSKEIVFRGLYGRRRRTVEKIEIDKVRSKTVNVHVERIRYFK